MLFYFILVQMGEPLYRPRVRCGRRGSGSFAPRLPHARDCGKGLSVCCSRAADEPENSRESKQLSTTTAINSANSGRCILFYRLRYGNSVDRASVGHVTVQLQRQSIPISREGACSTALSHGVFDFVEALISHSGQKSNGHIGERLEWH